MFFLSSTLKVSESHSCKDVFEFYHKYCQLLIHFLQYQLFQLLLNEILVWLDHAKNHSRIFLVLNFSFSNYFSLFISTLTVTRKSNKMTLQFNKQQWKIRSNFDNNKINEWEKMTPTIEINIEIEMKTSNSIIILLWVRNSNKNHKRSLIQAMQFNTKLI